MKRGDQVITKNHYMCFEIKSATDHLHSTPVGGNMPITLLTDFIALPFNQFSAFAQYESKTIIVYRSMVREIKLPEDTDP